MSFLSGFLSIFKKIDVVINDIEKAVEAPIEAVDPATQVFLSIFDRVQQAILGAESAFPAPGSGAAKSQAATDQFNGSLAIQQAALLANGKMLAYDPAALKKAQDDYVTAMNSIQSLQNSFKIVAMSRPEKPVSQ